MDQDVGPDFLTGGGDIAARMRAYNWAATPLGPMQTWPQSLRTALSIMLSSRFPTCLVWGADLTSFYNDAYRPILGSKPEALGRPFQEVWSEVWDTIGPIAARAFAGEATLVENLPLTIPRNGHPEQTHFTFCYSPIRNEGGSVGGVLCTAQETTDKVRADRERQDTAAALRESEDHYRHTIDLSPQIPWTAAPDGMVLEIGSRWLALIDTTRDETLRTGWIEALHPNDLAGTKRDWSRSLESGKPFDVEHRLRLANGQYRWFRTRAVARRDAEGHIVRWYGTVEDIHDRKAAAAALRGNRDQLDDERHALELLNRTGAQLAAELDLSRIVQMVTDAGVELTGAQFGAFFYNVLDEAGGRYTLYALSGVPREAFAKFPMPRNTAVFGPTFAGQGIVRSDDITKDPRYGKSGPHHGMPKGHLPVRSYLAVPVISRGGQVLGGLFFGHETPGVFTDRAERLMTGVAGQAAIAIDNARLFEAAQRELDERRRAEAALRELAETLETRVAERTQELAAANARLQAEIGERERAEQAARQSEQRFRTLVNGVTDYAIFMLDPAGLVANWNAGAERIKGYKADEIIGKHFSRFYTEEDRAAGAPARALALAAAEGKYEAEGWRVRKDGNRFWASVVIDPIRADDGMMLGYAKVTRDITERREARRALDEAREQLFQSQKLEAVGQLTGGIAHDFNNMLQGITGSLDMVQRRVAQGRTGELGRLIAGAMTSANRAAALTHRLLAFSRRQPLDPKPVHANPLVASMEDLLRRTMGEAIQIELVLAGGLWLTLCDPNQLESAILNLAINARDAMAQPSPGGSTREAGARPDGGKLTIETCNAHLDHAYAARQREVAAGQYVCICVTDTGTGMPPEVIARAFDPFFTTKPTGQGTGLGLSMIYGFARQSEGYCKIYSEVGRGTTVKLYLPRHHGQAAEEGKGTEPSEAHEGGEEEVVLVVEDESVVRGLVVEVLRELGYRALEAVDGPSGLATLQSRQRVDLLITDIGLPGLNGRQMADAARAGRPALKVLFMTGYAENAAIANGFLEPGMAMMTKPFSMDALATRIRGMIES